jgi:hypothetical protein
MCPSMRYNVRAKETSMAQIMIKCPATGQEVYTGISADSLDGIRRSGTGAYLKNDA